CAGENRIRFGTWMRAAFGQAPPAHRPLVQAEEISDPAMNATGIQHPGAVVFQDVITGDLAEVGAPHVKPPLFRVKYCQGMDAIANAIGISKEINRLVPDMTAFEAVLMAQGHLIELRFDLEWAPG